MCKIFIFKDITKQKVPRLCNFSIEQSNIKQKLFLSDAIESAMFFGSCAYSDYTIRSDINVLILYNPKRRSGAIHLLSELKFLAKEKHIPVNIIPIDTELALSGNHGLSSSFLNHLKIIPKQNCYIKGNPLDSLRFNPHESSYNEIRQYLINAICQMDKYEIAIGSASQQKILSSISKTLQLSIFIARKILYYHCEQFPNGDSNAEICGSYALIASQKERKIFMEIQALNMRYTEELEKQLISPHFFEYKILIEDLYQTIPMTREFAKENLLRFPSEIFT